MVDTYESTECKQCVCRFCAETFTKIGSHFSEEFCSENCLEMFSKNTIAESKLIAEIFKMSLKKESV